LSVCENDPATQPEPATDLASFLVAVSCLTDDTLRTVLHGARLRQRGPAPRLAGSEVVPMEVADAEGALRGARISDDGTIRRTNRGWPALVADRGAGCAPQEVALSATLIARHRRQRTAGRDDWGHPDPEVGIG
jgi:hypothetical protein